MIDNEWLDRVFRLSDWRSNLRVSGVDASFILEPDGTAEQLAEVDTVHITRK